MIYMCIFERWGIKYDIWILVIVIVMNIFYVNLLVCVIICIWDIYNVLFKKIFIRLFDYVY